ncbi:MAG: hypothetical protein E7621_07000 [Ruminococcaceae bacterium]|nr:hypothetical protein [Oscillospiraceae bacterium]
MKSNKKTNIVLSVLAVFLAIVATALIAVSAKSAFVSSRYEPPVIENDQKLPEKEEEQEPFEMWFDEAFAVFYPKQLPDLYPTRAVFYGDLDTKQPPFCLCSEKITDIEIFSVANGKKDKELMKVEYLEPMEAIILKVELSENPDIGISFKDAGGKKHSYGIARNADDSEVVLTKLAK